MRAYPKATLLTAEPRRPACLHPNTAAAKYNSSPSRGLAARIASIEPKGSRFLTGWTLSIPAPLAPR
jgi:hypothetical protein